MSSKESHFWFFLLNVSDRISELDPDSETYRTDILALLQSIQTTYGGCQRPLDQFERLVVTILCNTLCKALERMADERCRLPHDLDRRLGRDLRPD